MLQQIYTIHGLYNSVAIPLVYGYLAAKSTAAYEEFFEFVRKKIREESKNIISDFEYAAIKACQKVFVATELNGCLLTQSIWRKMQATGCNNSSESRSVLKR